MIENNEAETRETEEIQKNDLKETGAHNLKYIVGGTTIISLWGLTLYLITKNGYTFCITRPDGGTISLHP